MNYNSVVGQEETKQRLKQMVIRQRVPHAILLRGPAGSGTLPLALAFASHLLCRNRTEEGPCGNCPTCTKTARLLHPDLHLVFPISLNREIRTSDYWMERFRDRVLADPYLDLEDWFSEINADNKQPVIGSDEVNHIIKQLSYTSFEGAYKILLMWLPEKMNLDASNKILKILEEPSDKTIFLLVSQQPDQLLATIQSRVQQVPLVKLKNEEVQEFLVSQKSLNVERARQISHLADGDLHEAIKLCSGNGEEGEIDLVTHFQNFMRYAFNYDYPKMMQWVEENATLGREFHKRFFQYGLGIFRECLMLNYGSKDLVKLGEAELNFIRKFAPFINRENYENLIEEFNSGYYYIERNANSKILFMDLFGRCNALLSAAKKN